MICPSCQHENAPDANYCSNCGTYLIAPESDETQPMPQVGRNPERHVPVEPSVGQGAALVMRSGGGRGGERFTIGDKTTIGRSPANDIFLDDVTVSREHAVVYSDGESIRLEDRDSLNGTFVNHERVEKCQVQSGDEIQIGKYKLVYEKD
jgi:hypothetical protein